MALELNKLTHEVETLSTNAAKRAVELATLLPTLHQTLANLGVADEVLRAKVRKAGDRWPGALPSDDAIGGRFPLPAHPPELNVLGADGSQIYPDRHGSTLYYVINIGSIAYPHGRQQAPLIRSEPHVYYDDELYGDEGEGQIPSAIIDGKRDVAELGELVRLARERVGQPTVALVDNGLILWLALQLQDKHRRQVDAILRDYLQCLDDLHQAGAAVAGFVNRPRNANVLALLHVHSLPLEQINEDTLRHSPYRGLTDRMVFERLLQPGERSALFINNSPVNQRDFRHHQIHFFYLNVGRLTQSEIARVEVPNWVAHNPALLNLAHAAIVEQCRVPDGFPYVLVRAHELAVVSMEEREAFDTMVQSALAKHGILARISQKAQTKQWTNSRRRHRL
jgi:hypothetical protein